MSAMFRMIVWTLVVLVSHRAVIAQVDSVSVPPASHDDTPAVDLAAANEEPGLASRWWDVTTYWDNDGSILKRNNAQDRYYTNGSAISFAHEPQWAHDVADWLEVPSDHRIAAGYTLGQLIFTPENITTPLLSRNDRPYAGYLYAGAFWQHADAAVTTLDHVQLDLGIVGPSSLADPAQRFVHKFVDADEPQGWDHQLRDEPTIQLTLRKKWRALAGDLPVGDGHIMWDIIPAGGLHVGTVRREIEGTIMGRVGVNLPADFGPGRIGDVRSFAHHSGQAHAAPQALAFYVFGQATGRAVEHNLLIEGNTWKSSHGVDAEPLVGELRLGLAVQFAVGDWSFDVGYSQTFLSEEFKEQDNGHSFGSMVVSASAEF